MAAPRVSIPPHLLELADKAIVRRHGVAVSMQLGRAGQVALLMEIGIRALMPEALPEEAKDGR